MKIVRVRGDGQCLFRCLALASGLSVREVKTKIHERVRKSKKLRDILDAVAVASEDEEDAVNAVEYASSTSSPLFQRSFFGGEFEILVASRVLDACIVVLDGSMRHVTTHHKSARRRNLIVLRLLEKHYDLVVAD